MSVLFSDLSGYTAASERLDPEELREVMTLIFEQAAKIVARHQGRIEKFIGDAVMAIFGVPVAHEDDAERAIRAAIELHDAVALLNPDLEPRIGAALAMHSGIASGIVVTGELTFDHGTAGPLGSTINLAARLMAAAPDGQIWISSDTRRLLGGRVETEDLGRRSFKGMADDVAVARVRGLSGSRTALPSPVGLFVGRATELDRLSAALSQVRSGRTTAIGLVGEPGCGKSRLFTEFRLRLGTNATWLEGRAFEPSSDTPFAPLIDLLSRFWEIDDRHGPDQVRARISAALEEWLGGDSAVALPLFLHLYRLEQAAGVVVERESFPPRLCDAVHRLLAAVARRTPLVIGLQDMHWADRPTTMLLRDLFDAQQVPLLLLLNYRPGFEPWPQVEELRLGELSPEQTNEMVASLMGAEPSPQITRFVVERSDGNPFYAEELVHSLIETGFVSRDGEGRCVMTHHPEAAGIPPTVRGVIAARIDRLGAPYKTVLRNSSVVGRAFLRSIVVELTEDPARLDASLHHLSEADLVRQRDGAPDAEYWFKHALTHEVAYESLLKSERQRLHGEVGQAFRADPRGALEVIDRALDESGASAPQHVTAYLLAWRAHALMSLGHHEEAAGSAQAVALLNESAHPTSYARIKSEVCRSRLLAYKGDLQESRRIAQRLIEVGTVSGNARASAQGHAAMHSYWMLALDFERAAAAAVEGMRAARDPTFIAMNAMWATAALTIDMRFTEAQRLCDRHLAFLMEGGNHWFGRPMLAARDVIAMSRGRLSAGMRAALASVEWARNRGWDETRFYSEVYLLLIYVSLARREPAARPFDLLRNPWFVTLQALFASRHAKRLLQLLRSEVATRGIHGFDGLMDLAEARLLAHRRQTAAAQLILERMRARLRGFGIEHEPAPLAQLAREIGAAP
ncbi:MAG: AAA family ATPase [Rubrivivax sp.]|nr:AAA family ATPase [Rubrivivax sp.]